MDRIIYDIMQDEDNQSYTAAGIEPLFSAPKAAKILMIGQAPGLLAQNSRLFFNDRSGDRLRDWLGVDRETFYDSGLFAVLPMDFYYPGRGRSGDLPPRKGFAAKWHPPLLAQLEQVELVLLLGTYAQNHYLGPRKQENLTQTVKQYRDYLPRYFPLIHPSPRNQPWLAKNPWFESELLPLLREQIRHCLGENLSGED